MWLKPQGFAEVVSPDGGRIVLDRFQCEEVSVGISRYDSMTCNHCNRVTHIKARTDPADMGGLCPTCLKLICRYCLDQGCFPYVERLAIQELGKKLDRETAIKSYGV